MREQNKTLGISSWIPPIQGKGTPGTAPVSPLAGGRKVPLFQSGLWAGPGDRNPSLQGQGVGNSLIYLYLSSPWHDRISGCFGILALLLLEVRLSGSQPGILQGHRETKIPGKRSKETLPSLCTWTRMLPGQMGVSLGRGKEGRKWQRLSWVQGAGG